MISSRKQRRLSVRAFCGTLALLLVLASVAQPRQARAQEAVFDAANVVQTTLTAVASLLSSGADAITSAGTASLQVKEYGLDPVAWVVAKQGIQMMTKSMVNWINSGFNGSPAFITNLSFYLQNVGDAAALGFLDQIALDPAIESPFRSTVTTLAQLDYLRSTGAESFFLQNPYTLNQYTSDDVGFLNGTTFDGGWRAWLALSEPQNNPRGAFQLIRLETGRKAAQAQTNARQQADWGQGFLSWCGSSAPPASGGAGSVSAGVDRSQICTNADGSPGSVQTPGSVIQNQINETLGLTGEQLVSADEFNEIIGALMSQMVSQVLGGTGLSGLSSQSSGGSYLDRATAISQLENGTDQAAIATAFENNIGISITNVTRYQASWQEIADDAAAAEDAYTKERSSSTRGNNSNTFTCEDRIGSEAGDKIDEVQDQARTAIARAAAALVTLNDLKTKAATARSITEQQGEASYQEVSAAYQAFIVSNAMPTATDFADVELQKQDVPSTTLTAQMNAIVRTCNQFML